jgi:hypothetical protein
VFDLVQPPSPSERLRGWAGQAGLAKIGEGYATQQHGPSMGRARWRVESFSTPRAEGVRCVVDGGRGDMALTSGIGPRDWWHVF